MVMLMLIPMQTLLQAHVLLFTVQTWTRNHNIRSVHEAQRTGWPHLLLGSWSQSLCAKVNTDQRMRSPSLTH